MKDQNQISPYWEEPTNFFFHSIENREGLSVILIFLCWIYVPICFANTITAINAHTATLYQYTTSHMTLCNLIKDKTKFIFFDILTKMRNKMKNPHEKLYLLHRTYNKNNILRRRIWMKVIKKFFFFSPSLYECVLYGTLWCVYNITQGPSINFSIFMKIYVEDNFRMGILSEWNWDRNMMFISPTHQIVS